MISQLLAWTMESSIVDGDKRNNNIYERVSIKVHNFRVRFGNGFLTWRKLLPLVPLSSEQVEHEPSSS